MVRTVEETIARCRMFAPGDRVGAAVSGGADSVALLDCLLELRASLGITVGVVHFHHGLRGEEADLDQRFVERLARRLGLRFITASAEENSLARASGVNLEAAAREQRYRFFSELVRSGEFTKIATGHTRSDQAETVLFRLLRGSGAAGLSAIRTVRPDGVVRPLIELSREQVRSCLHSRGLAWREDSSNLDERYDRNRIRARLLPALRRDWNPRIEEALARTARQASEDEEYWRLEVAERADRLFTGSAGGLEFETSPLGGLHPALLGRLLREAVRRARGSLNGIGFEHIERLKALVASGRGAGRVDLPGLRAERSFGRVRLVLRDRSDKEEGGAEGLSERGITQPGEYLSPDGKGKICLKFGSKAGNGRYNDSTWSFLDWEKTPRPLLLRSWRSGDRLRPVGAEAPRKLKRLFQRCRVARWDRAGWPVLAAEDSSGERVSLLVWARGFGASADFAAGAGSRVVVGVAEFGLERREKSWNQLPRFERL